MISSTPGWESVASEDDPSRSMRIERFGIPGGWLFKVTEELKAVTEELKAVEWRQFTVTFVPFGVYSPSSHAKQEEPRHEV